MKSVLLRVGDTTECCTEVKCKNKFANRIIIDPTKGHGIPEVRTLSAQDMAAGDIYGIREKAGSLDDQLLLPLPSDPISLNRAPPPIQGVTYS